MNDSISIILGTPEHGWLPVYFRYKDFVLDFEASDGLNNPVEELFGIVTKLQDNEIRRVTWWLEPEAYFFDVKKTGLDISLIITKTTDIHNSDASQTILQKITGIEKQIIEPLKTAIQQFSSHTYDEIHWSKLWNRREQIMESQGAKLETNNCMLNKQKKRPLNQWAFCIYRT